MNRIMYWAPVVILGLAYFGVSMWDERRGPALLIAVIGIGLALFALVGLLRKRALVRRSRVTLGEVVRLEPKGSCFASVFRFTDADGVEQELISDSASAPPAHKVGDRVEVVFDPSKPQEARIRSFWSLYGGETVVVGMGLAFVLVGLLIFFIPAHGVRVRG